jgi:NADH-quinone oxidoreductase subunit J
MNFSGVLFAILATATGLSALGVVFSRNIVRSAVWLLFTLVGVAGLYFYLGMEFLGSAQLIVYVGGTLVLVVFGVMLTAQNPASGAISRRGEIVSASLLGVVFFGLLVYTSIQFAESVKPTPLAHEQNAVSVGTLGMSFANLTEVSPSVPLAGFPAKVEAPNRTANAYLLPFEILSVHLLVVLIGAAYLARAKRSQPREGSR